MKKSALFIAALLFSLSLYSQSFIYNEYERLFGMQGQYTNGIMEADDGSIFMSVKFRDGDVARIMKLTDEGQVMEQRYIEFKNGSHRGYYPFFRHPEQAGMNVYVYFSHGSPTYYNAVVFDNNLNITKQIRTPMPYSDVEAKDNNSRNYIFDFTESCILDSENNIVVMKRIDETQDFIFVKLDLNGNIITTNEVKIDLNPENWIIPYHALTVYNENPMQYAFAFTKTSGNFLPKLCLVVLDSELNIIETDFNNTMDIYFGDRDINLVGYDDESYLTSTMHFDGAPISYSISLRKKNKKHEIINEYEYRGYRNSETYNDPIPYVFEKNIVTTEDGHIYWIYSLLRDDNKNYDLHISYFDSDLNLIWERLACENVTHHTWIISADVRDDGSLILNAYKPEGEIFTLVMDKKGTVMDIDEQAMIKLYSIYPNPASDFVKISADSGQLSNVKVYNCLGMLVEEKEVNASEVEINISDYNSGIYFIEADGVVRKIAVK